MTKNQYILLFALALVMAMPATAQIQLVAPVGNADPAASVVMPVRVAKFNKVIGVQFSLRWNPAILKVNKVSNFGELKITNPDSYFRIDNDNGALVFAWYDNSTNGVTKPDSTTIFSIECTVLGKAGDTTRLEFKDSPTEIEIIQDSAGVVKVIPPVLVQGLFKVNGMTKTIETRSGAITPLRILGNPFDDHLDLEIDVETKPGCRLTVLGASGTALAVFRQEPAAGWQRLRVGQEYFPAPGLYYLLLETGGHSYIEKVIRL